MRRRGAALACLLALLGSASAQDGESAPAAAGPSRALMAPKAAENRLLDIALAGTRLVAVGQHGVILRSEDGKAWQQSESPASAMLTRLRFTDDRQGWALGYDATILHTGDGGTTWTVRHHDPEARALYDLLFLDAQRGLAVGAYGTVLETTDGGATWSARDNVLSDLGMHLNSVVRLGDGSLFAAGERGLMARSVDDGSSWAVIDSPYAGSLFGALPRGDKGVLVHGMRGNVYMAPDLTATPVVEPASWDPYARQTASTPERLATLGWRKLESPTLESLFGNVSLAGGDTLLLGVNGTVLKLDHAADTLTAVQTPAAETLTRGVQFNDRVVAVGRRGVTELGISP